LPESDVSDDEEEQKSKK